MNADQPAPTEELAGESTLADAATNGANSGAPARSNGTGNGAPGLQPDPDGNGHHEGAIPGTNEDVFAKAVGLAEAPPKAKRGRRRSNTSRPVVTPEDAARLATSTAPIATQPAPQPQPTPMVEPGVALTSRKPGWLTQRRARVRRTRRTIRHVDPWSVFKVSLLLYICLYIAAMIAGVLLWSAAVNSGVIENIESFVEEVGSYQVWELNGEEIFRRSSVIGIVLMVAGVAFNVLMAIVFNLISDLVGGVRVTILEEDSVPRPTV